MNNIINWSKKIILRGEKCLVYKAYDPEKFSAENWRRCLSICMRNRINEVDKWWPTEKKLFFQVMEQYTRDGTFSKLGILFHLVGFRVSCTFLGICCNDWFSFDFLNHGWIYRSKCISQQRQAIAENILNPNCDILDNKALFAEKWKRFFNRQWAVVGEKSKLELKNVFKNTERIIVKPICGSQGRHVFILDKYDLFQMYEQIESKYKGWMMEECIQQKGDLHNLNTSSVNTIRVCTVRSKSGISVLFAKLRVGQKGKFIDNAHAGGSLYNIDIWSGRVRDGIDYSGKRVIRFPHTEIEVKDFGIPCWEKIIEFCCDAHQLAPDRLRLIGWDVCCSVGPQSSRLYMIEGNGHPAFGPPQEGLPNPWKTICQLLDEYTSK